MSDGDPKGSQPPQPQWWLRALGALGEWCVRALGAFLVCVGALFLGLALFVIGMVLYVVSLALRGDSPNGLSAVLGFSYVMITFLLPVLAAGVFFGRLYQRWGWLPALVAASVATLGLLSAAAPRHAIFVPAAALLGWAAGAWSRRCGVQWWLSAGLALTVLVCAALLVGRSDRDWLMAHAWAVARDFGVQSRQTPKVDVMDFAPGPGPGGLYARVMLDEPPRSPAQSWERYGFWLGARDFRRRRVEDAFAERRVNLLFEQVPVTVAAAKDTARRLGVPERLLAGLHGRAPFSTGPSPGTWRRPHVEITESWIIVQIGERPH